MPTPALFGERRAADLYRDRAVSAGQGTRRSRPDHLAVRGSDSEVGWLCCVASELALHDQAGSVSRSDDLGEFGERGRDATAGAGFDAEFVVPAAHVLHERVAVHDHPRGAVAFEAAHRTKPRFEPAMV
jgi:hypothetical protein